MIKEQNDCVNCGLPCLHSGCPYRHVPHYYCDKCGKEVTDLSYREGEDKTHICPDCLKEMAKEKFDELYKEFEDEIAEYFGYGEEK